LASTLTREQLEKFWNADAIQSVSDPVAHIYVVGDPRYVEYFDAYVETAGLEGDAITALRADIVAKHEAAAETLEGMEYGYTQRLLDTQAGYTYNFEGIDNVGTAEKTIFTGLEAPEPLSAEVMAAEPVTNHYADIQATKDAAAISTISDGMKGQVYQGVMMLVGGTTLANTPIPNLTGSQFDSATANFLETFDANESFAGDDVQSRTQAIAILRKGAAGEDLTGTEQAIFNTMLAVHGYAEDDKFSFNSSNTEAEQGFAATIVAGYESNQTRVDLINGAETTRVAEAATAANAAREAAALEAERLAAARAAAEAATAATQVTLRRDNSFAALGYTGTLSENTIGLANDFEKSLIRQGFGTDFRSLVTNLEDPEKLQGALSYVISNGDYREQFLAKLEAGDAASISNVQAALGVTITGEFNEATLGAATTYMTSEIGLGDTHFRETFSSSYNDYLVAEGLEDSDAVFATFQDANPTEFRYGLSQNSVMNGIKDGTIPVLDEALPTDLQDMLKSMPGDAFEHQRAMLIAQHLTSDNQNFINYDAALKARSTEGMTARLDAIEVTEPEVAPNTVTPEGPGYATPAMTERFSSMTASVVAETATLTTESDALSTAVETEGMSFDTIFTRIPADFTVNENTPAEVKEFIALRANLEASEEALSQYQRFPNTLNLNNSYGVTVIGAVGAPNSVITQALDNDITRAQNAYMTHFNDMPADRKQAVLRHLDDPTAPLEVTPEVTPDAEPAPENGALVSEFQPAHDTDDKQPVQVTGSGFTIPEAAAASPIKLG